MGLRHSRIAQIWPGDRGLVFLSKPDGLTRGKRGRSGYGGATMKSADEEMMMMMVVMNKMKKALMIGGERTA